MLRLILFEKIDSLRIKIHQLSISDDKCSCLPGKLGKDIKFVTFLFTPSTKFDPLIFSNWEPGARPKIAHAYYVFPL